MGEGHAEKYVGGVKTRLTMWFILIGLAIVIIQWALAEIVGFKPVPAAAAAAVIVLLSSFIIGSTLGESISRPARFIAQAVFHIAPGEHLVAAPDVQKLKLGREMTDSVVRQVYGLATASTPVSQNTQSGATLIDLLPVAAIGVDSQQKIVFANPQAAQLLQNNSLSGQHLKDTLQLLTEDETDPISWSVQAAESKLTARNIWKKVEVKNLSGNSVGYFDIAASFSQHSSSGADVIFVFFDHSDAYAREEDSIGFISMAVHELRTPITLMRGYIEAFGGELKGNTNPQIAEDLRRMSVSADTLASFVSNILNVAKINQGQLSLKLSQENWNALLPQILQTLQLRAQAYGKNIELKMQPEMPAAAIDRGTITEVITNLIDNAIKYSPEDRTQITVVSQVNGEGFIETTVQDHGVGIPASVVPNLFTKFYRNHRTRAQIGGTGLGLFLSKSIVNAHHGNIWVTSKENEGSTFGFTLLTYDKLAAETVSVDNEAIVRSKHGWIKNHAKQRQ